MQFVVLDALLLFSFFFKFVCFEHLQFFFFFFFEEIIYNYKIMQPCINSIVFHLCLTDVLTVLF